MQRDIKSIKWFLSLIITGLLLVLFSTHVAAIDEPDVEKKEIACPKERPEPQDTISEIPDIIYTFGKKLSAVKVTSPPFEVRIRDGNPLFSPGNENAWADSDGIYPVLGGPVSVYDLEFSDLEDLEAKRKGVAADGVSQLILLLESWSPGTFEITPLPDSGEDGTLELIGPAETCETKGSHLTVALYTPPMDFGKGSGIKVPKEMLGGVEARTVELDFTFIPDNEEDRMKRTIKLQLLRPPVVLVHGFGDEPINAWMTPISVGMSLNELLKNKGFLPFLVDYQNSNGRGFAGGGASSFRDNRFVVWNGMSTADLPSKDGNEINKSWKTIENKISENNITEAFVGGIRQAITYYREELEIAATKADVVGHSMGGILPRVYAADKLPEELPEFTEKDKSDDAVPPEPYNERYERPDNFKSGDINRLVTLNTPHGGSEQPTIFEQLTKKRLPETDWANYLYKTVADSAAFLARVRADSKAMQGLNTRSRALRLIGETHVPSHVIAGVTMPGQQQDLYYDASRSYMLVLEAVGGLFYFFPHHLDDYIDSVRQEYESKDKYNAEYMTATLNFQELIDSESTYWAGVKVVGGGWLDMAAGSLIKMISGGDLNPAVQVLLDKKDTLVEGARATRRVAETGLDSAMGAGGDHSETLKIPYVFLEALRSFMFRFDKNDSTVRLDSQLGGLDLQEDKNFITYIDIEGDPPENPDIWNCDLHIGQSVLHSQAPRYIDIQRRIVALLKSDREKQCFRKSLPEAGSELALHKPEIKGVDWILTGDYARKWSGMVYDHADAYLEVAKKEKVVIMTRPVNPDSTALIESGAATKSMNVKGKSSNWGPQKGYIPADQTYSKLWKKPKGERVGQIKDYTEQTIAMLKKTKPEYEITQEILDAYTRPGHQNKLGEAIAIQRHLDFRKDNNLYTVWARPGTRVEEYKENGKEKYKVIVEEWINSEDAEQWVFLCKESSPGNRTSAKKPCDCPRWLDWKDNSAVQPSDCKLLRPLEVLADNAHLKENYLTADYDLLTFGFHCPDGASTPRAACKGTVIPTTDPKNKCLSTDTVDAFPGRLWDPPDPLPCMDTHKGLITEQQKIVLKSINKTVQETGYSGGNVSHHGPETQFFKSPYVDYPIIAFDPGITDENNKIIEDTDKIIAIPEGPPGFRDLHLKRYFTRKIRQGFWIYPNPYSTANWYWKQRRPLGSSELEFFGWRDEDDKRVPQGQSAAEIKKPVCVQEEEARRRRERAVRNDILADKNDERDPASYIEPCDPVGGCDCKRKDN